VGGEQDEGLWVGLADAVNGVRAELESARAKAQADTSGLLFEVGSVEIEFAVDITEDKDSSTGVDVRVLSLRRAWSAGLTESHWGAILIRIDGPRQPDFGPVRWGRFISTAPGVPWELAGFPCSQKLSGDKRAVEPLRGELDPMADAPHNVQLELADPVPQAEFTMGWDLGRGRDL
jgi:hypothetical protein